MASIRVRRRNALLEALELFSDLHPGISLGTMITFLYACENEGATILDLSLFTGFHVPTASRNIRTFCRPDVEGAMSPALGLVEVTKTAYGKAIHLNEAGLRFRRQLDAVIAEARPIDATAGA